MSRNGALNIDPRGVEYSVTYCGLLRLLFAVMCVGALPDICMHVMACFFFVSRGIDEVTISVHGHDDLGMAVANFLSAIEGGARQVGVGVGVLVSVALSVCWCVGLVCSCLM